MKRFLSILLAMVMVLSLVACGDKKTPDTPNTPDTPDKQEEAIHIGIVTGSVSAHGGNDGGRTDLQLIKCHLFFSPNDFDVLMVTFPPRPVNTAAEERPFII